jgi:hypothetical protein
MNIRSNIFKFLLAATSVSQTVLPICIWPVIDSLKKSADYIDSMHNTKDLSTYMGWDSINVKQDIFLRHYFSKRSELGEFLNKELRSWVSHDYATLNKILTDNGFSIQLRPFASNSFGVVSILDVLIEWLHEGLATSIDVEANQYPAVSIKQGFDVKMSPHHEYPIVAIKTKSGDTVYMTVADRSRYEFDLLGHIELIQGALREYNPSLDGYSTFLNHSKYNQIIFPMVNIDKEEDVTWLLGLKKGDWRIAQALQQTKFKMDEKGARVESAVALHVEKTYSKPIPFVINKPFFIWISRPGCTAPVFAEYITEVDWKKP